MTNVWDQHALRAIQEWARVREIALRVIDVNAGLSYRFVVECADPECEIRYDRGLKEITTFANWIRFADEYNRSAREQPDKVHLDRVAHHTWITEYDRRVAEFNQRYPELTHVWA